MKVPFALLLLALLAACSAVRVAGDPDLRLERGARYAWSSTSENGIDEDVPLDRYLDAVADELELRGVSRATTASADYLVDVAVEIETRIQQNDPVFSLYTAHEVEDARVTVRILEAGADRVLWAGECVHELRTTARSLGGTPPLWESLDRQREWLPDAQVERIFERLAR